MTSPRVAKLGWAEEVFYRRLMSVVDDFGRYYGDPGMLRAACYPRQLSKVSDSDIEKWLACAQKAALVRVYEAEDSERYIELLDFKQQVRAKDSKFPSPRSKCVADATQTNSSSKSNAHLDVSVDVDVKEPTVLVDGKPPTDAQPVTLRVDCPYEKLFEAWEENAYSLALPKPVAEWTQARKTAIRARWQEKLKLGKYADESSGLAYWRKLFAFVEASDFLAGRASPGVGRTKPFVADIDWVFNPTNLQKIIEGKYVNDERVAA